jgi:vancomycin resistance protein YoaR
MKTWMLRSIVIGLGIGLLIAASAAAYGLRTTLPEGMKISGWEVGDWEASSFEKGLAEQLAVLQGKEVRMKAELPRDGTAAVRSATLGELGLFTNAEVVEAEVNRLFSGPIWERALLRWQWRDRELTLSLGLEQKTFLNRSKEMWPELYESQPVNASRRITANDQVKYTPEVLAARLDEYGLLQAVLLGMHGVDGDGPVALPGSGSGGLYRDPHALKPDGTLLAAAPIPVSVPVFALKPEVTVESLKAEGIDRVIASFSTSFATSGAGRQHNVKSTASVVHDIMLAPGDVFDYGAVIKETEKKYGFRQAPVILNGKLVPGIGGGICQVSTTLYNAVLRAGLEIVERRNHSLPVNYAPLGQDATFANGYINFKFKNSTGKHLLIRTSSEGNRLTVKLFGTLDRNVSYDIRSVTLKEIDPPKKFVKNPTLPKGSVQLLQAGKIGYVVETYRYKLVSGKIVDKERISKDTYKAQPALYASNTGQPSEGVVPSPEGKGDIIEDGVQAPVFD